MSEHGPGPLCAGCGKCCEALPGAYHPDDFGLNMPDALRELFATGKACLDWREAPRIFYPRPQTINARGKLMDPSYGGQCVNLGPEGCELSREKMPAECRWLKPQLLPSDGCVSTMGGSKTTLADAWEPYQSLLSMVVKEAMAEQKKRAGLTGRPLSPGSHDCATRAGGRGDLSPEIDYETIPLADLALLALAVLLAEVEK